MIARAVCIHTQQAAQQKAGNDFAVIHWRYHRALANCHVFKGNCARREKISTTDLVRSRIGLR
jgi:hypothetical protein